MSTVQAAPSLPAPARPSPLRSIVAATWAPDTWATALHLVLNLPLGVAWFTILSVGGTLGLGLIVTLLGVPVLALTALTVRAAARFERARVRVLLGLPLAEPPPRVAAGSWPRRFASRAADPALWRDALYLVLRLPIGLVTFTLTFSIGLTALVAILAPIHAWWMPDDATLFGLPAHSIIGVITSFLVGIVLSVGWAWMVRGMAALERVLAGALLGPSPAALQARVGELARSRDRSLEASVEDRRRIERDLHDGAQQRMISVGMTLGLALQKMNADPAAAGSLVREAHDECKRAIQELRDLARGIHPALLTERGLPAALQALAARSAVPVDLAVDVATRPAPAIESAAYFVVSEALANAGKHSSARRAGVSVRRLAQRLVVEVTDDGRGGAAMRPGGGLAGLADRVAAVDGSLTVSSPPGGPTLVHAEMPCGS